MTVLAWIGTEPVAGVFTTTLTQADILYGLALLPAGRRRDKLLEAAGPMVGIDVAGRILPFDSVTAQAYAEIAAVRRQNRNPIRHIDAQIAAIARSRGAALATRNVSDFDDCGISIVDSWKHR